jgi:hypothetical protein
LEISHKTQAAAQFLAPAAILYTFFGAYLLNDGWPKISVLEESSASFALVGLAAMLVQDFVPKPAKECIVFWRITNRMPGHRAFTEKFLRNQKIDAEKIPNIENLSASSAHVQQREFYKLYRSVSDDRSVAHYSQRYIAWRDLSALLIILGIVSIPVLYTFSSTAGLKVGTILAAVAFSVFLLTSLAARNSANELIILVLSLIGQKGEKSD